MPIVPLLLLALSTPNHWFLTCKGVVQTYGNQPATEVYANFDIDFKKATVKADIKEKNLPTFEHLPTRPDYKGEFAIDWNYSGFQIDMLHLGVPSANTEAEKKTQFLRMENLDIEFDVGHHSPKTLPQKTFQAFYSHREAYFDLEHQDWNYTSYYDLYRNVDCSLE